MDSQTLLRAPGTHSGECDRHGIYIGWTLGCVSALTLGLTSQQAAGSAPESVEVVDVAQMLRAAVRRGTPA